MIVSGVVLCNAYIILPHSESKTLDVMKQNRGKRKGGQPELN